MAPKKAWKSPVAAENEKAEFINYELTAEDVRKLKGDLLPRFEAADALTKLVEEGYKVNFKYDEYSKSPAVYLIPATTTHRNAGRILTGRGRTAYGALVEVSYKHWVVFEGAWPDRKDKQSFALWED